MTRQYAGQTATPIVELSQNDLEFIHAAAWAGQNLIDNPASSQVNLAKVRQTLSDIMDRLTATKSAPVGAVEPQVCCSSCAGKEGAAFLACLEFCNPNC